MPCGWLYKLLIPALLLLSSHSGLKGEVNPLLLPSSGGTITAPRYDSRDPIVTSEPATSTIPFTRAGNLIVIKARVDSTEGNFILDTGAPGLILNITYFRHYSSTETITEHAGGITGIAIQSNPTEVGKLSFGNINYHKVETDRINLGHIENSKGIKILGLLGMNLFKRFEMIIDYEKNEIYLHLIAKKEAKKYKHQMLMDTSLYREFEIDLKDNKILTYGKLAGKKLTFVIDTGAESNVLDSRLPDKIFEKVQITRRIMLSGSGSKKVEALFGEMKEMKFGDFVVESLPVVVTNLEKMCFSYDRCLDGMLGFDFLSKHKIGFNFVNRKMYIWK